MSTISQATTKLYHSIHLLLLCIIMLNKNYINIHLKLGETNMLKIRKTTKILIKWNNFKNYTVFLYFFTLKSNNNLNYHNKETT